MEGPSLFLASEQLISFKGKKVKIVSGNTKIGKERLLGQTVKDVFSWGKHLVFQFDGFAIRTHFLLFGTYEATIDGVTVTGDYKRTYVPRLMMEFDNGNIKMFNCSIKIFDDIDLKKTYDFSADIMSPSWNSKKALKKVLDSEDEQIADVLLDQEVFAGVGNIIKNEVLFLTKTNPHTLIKDLSEKKLREIIDKSHSFSHQFYEWRKIFQLRAHLVIYRKKLCPGCSTKIIREKTGKRLRWSYYCNMCQPVANANALGVK